MIFSILLLIMGLIILIAGAEGLVRGSTSLAKKIGIPPLIIGLTIVAFGTSMPELIVNIFAALEKTSDIAVGNIIGSNIFNILFILGLVSIFRPLTVKSSTVWKEIPFALLAMIMVFIMGNDSFFDKTGLNALTRTDGFSLIAMFLIFMIYILSLAKKNKDEEQEKIKIYSWGISISFISGGLILLFLGGKLLVDSAIVLAQLAGLSESLIGLTIVAIGTSLPELATSAIAAYHRHNDIAVGNIVGSNIFNIFWILGLTSSIFKLPFNPGTNVDLTAGIIATFLLFIFMFIGTRKKLDRWQGVLFLMSYIAYTIYLIIRG
ncbi:MAG: calcium/sodium antiporter [Patescibacteria group bacterium]